MGKNPDKGPAMASPGWVFALALSSPSRVHPGTGRCLSRGQFGHWDMRGQVQKGTMLNWVRTTGDVSRECKMSKKIHGTSLWNLE
jgi:hypothetical protein